jgi:hypothetical protein
MTDVDYTACPGGCTLRELTSGGRGLGCRYGCLGREEIGAGSSAFYSAEYSAWLCVAAIDVLQEMREAGTAPDPDPLMKTHAREYRASIRSMGRF